MNYINSKSIDFQGNVNNLSTLPTIEKKRTATEKIEIFYAYEPLCGWCYGFSDELNKLIRKLKSIVDFKLINGGIFAGDDSLKMGVISEHIKRNMGNVTERSGIEFGNEFLKLLENKNYDYDSKKASIAVAVLRDMFPEKLFEFAANIQKAFFYYGKDIQSDSFYVELLKAYPINLTDFLEKLNSQIESIKIEYEFKTTQKLGFQGYPAMAVKANGKMKILNQGYTTVSQLIPKIYYAYDDFIPVII